MQLSGDAAPVDGVLRIRDERSALRRVEAKREREIDGLAQRLLDRLEHFGELVAAPHFLRVPCRPPP